VKILTGDNPLISRKVCRDVGLVPDPMLLGAEIEKLSDAELAEKTEQATLFARLSPAHKERVIRILRGTGHVVGFMEMGSTTRRPCAPRMWASPWTPQPTSQRSRQI